jgi:hypothetical protein
MVMTSKLSEAMSGGRFEAKETTVAAIRHVAIPTIPTARNS